MVSGAGTAVVTGGGVRLGRLIALDLAQAGYNIALHYRSSEGESKEAAEQIRAKGVECELFHCDLSRGQEALSLIRRIASIFEDCNLLVNNASGYTQGSISETAVEQFDELFAVNLRAPFFLTQQFAEVFRSGLVINVVDTKISFNQFQFAAYLLTKKALLDFTRLAAVEYAPRLRVNGISPGLILPAASRTPDYLEWRRRNIPLQRMGSPRHILSTIRFLCENDYITGECIAVDGGEAQSCVGGNVVTFEAIEEE